MVKKLNNYYAIVVVATIAQVSLALAWLIMAVKATTGNFFGWLAIHCSEKMVALAAVLYLIPVLWCLLQPQYESQYNIDRREAAFTYLKANSTLNGFEYLELSFKEKAIPVGYGYAAASVMYIIGFIVIANRFL